MKVAVNCCSVLFCFYAGRARVDTLLSHLAHSHRRDCPGQAPRHNQSLHWPVQLGLGRSCRWVSRPSTSENWIIHSFVASFCFLRRSTTEGAFSSLLTSCLITSGTYGLASASCSPSFFGFLTLGLCKSRSYLTEGTCLSSLGSCFGISGIFGTLASYGSL